MGECFGGGLSHGWIQAGQYAWHATLSLSGVRCHQETFQVVRLDATACLAQIGGRASLKAGAILDGVALDAACI